MRYIKIYGPWPLDPGPHALLYLIKTVVKIRPALKKSYLMN